jgi:hypothetical protein
LLTCSVAAATLAAGIGAMTVSAGSQGASDTVAQAKVSKAAKKKNKLRGPRGKRGPQGPPGPAGPPGHGLNFNRVLTANSSSAISTGAFTITAASDANGNCVNIKLRTNHTDARLSVGSGAGFIFLKSGTDASVQSGDTSQMFTAVTENGQSTMSGIVGRVSVGGRCFVSGYVTGV